MKHFFLITNTLKDPDFLFTKKICAYIKKKGGSCSYTRKSGLEESYTQNLREVIPAETQVILVVGGDGTLIKAARDTFGLEIPLIGVNLGHLGYLCELEENTVFHAIDELFLDHYMEENRMMLEGSIKREDGTEIKHTALNDIVIHRSGSLHVIHYDVYVNHQFLNSYKADGIILATPTGSTAYNLSAGGPIVDPKANLMLLTPINNHSLNARSIVLDSSNHVEIRIGSRGRGNDGAVEVSVDGDASIALNRTEAIEVRATNQSTKFLKISKMSFLEILHKKMQSLP